MWTQESRDIIVKLTSNCYILWGGVAPTGVSLGAGRDARLHCQIWCDEVCYRHSVSVMSYNSLCCSTYNCPWARGIFWIIYLRENSVLQQQPSIYCCHYWLFCTYFQLLFSLTLIFFWITLDHSGLVFVSSNQKTANVDYNSPTVSTKRAKWCTQLWIGRKEKLSM